MFISCGGSSDNSTTKDTNISQDTTNKEFVVKVKVIDGYIKNAHVVDGLSKIAKYKESGIYEFDKNITPEVFIKATGGQFENSNLDNELELYADINDTILSPLSTFIYKSKDKQDMILKTLSLQKNNLKEDFISTNNKYLAKLNQILYILEVNNLQDEFKNKLEDKKLSLDEISKLKA